MLQEGALSALLRLATPVGGALPAIQQAEVVEPGVALAVDPIAEASGEEDGGDEDGGGEEAGGGADKKKNKKKKGKKKGGKKGGKAAKLEPGQAEAQVGPGPDQEQRPHSATPAHAHAPPTPPPSVVRAAACCRMGRGVQTH